LPLRGRFVLPPCSRAINNTRTSVRPGLRWAWILIMRYMVADHHALAKKALEEVLMY
jgi:hypothetical protein